MSKGTRWIKRAIALSLVLLLSIESFGAIVSDNDGSAFITKAEFDSLKNDFQSQIDSYNTSIDSKIDGAIAAYLAGVRVSQVSELATVLGDYYELPLVNYKSTLQVKKELEECYIAMDFAGFWNFTYSGASVATNPGSVVCTSDGKGHSGFVLDTNYASENAEYKIKDICKELNLKFVDRFTYGSSTYQGTSETSRRYCHGWVSLLGGVNGNLVSASDGWYLYSNHSSLYSSPAGFAVLYEKDSSSTLGSFSSATEKNWSSIRLDKPIAEKFKIVAEKSKKYQFIISNPDVKVPIIADGGFTSTFNLGMAIDKWPKRKSDDWQDINFDVLTITNPQYSNYKLQNFWSDIRFYFPTFLEKRSGTFDTLDTLQKCAKLYTFFDIKGTNTKVYPISGAILAVMDKNAEKVDFVFDFKETANKKKYHLLFKKNEAFTYTDITNLKSIDYVLNGKKAEKTDYAASGEIKVTINNLEKGDVLWMTWVTEDTADGGTLNKIVSAKMTGE